MNEEEEEKKLKEKEEEEEEKRKEVEDEKGEEEQKKEKKNNNPHFWCWIWFQINEIKYMLSCQQVRLKNSDISSYLQRQPSSDIHRRSWYALWMNEFLAIYLTQLNWQLWLE